MRRAGGKSSRGGLSRCPWAVGEAVGEASAIAHQVHGAIGFTEEHILHRYTQRLWDWRDDFGSESEWAVQLGEMIAEKGADELWPLLTAR